MILLFLPISALADHTYGGYISFRTTDAQNGIYGFSMRLYIDFNTLGYATRLLESTPLKLSIYRKKDNTFLRTVTIRYKSKKKVVFENVACATSQNFNIMVYNYSDDNIRLDPNDFADPDGYYISFDNCCRNSALNNIVNPGRTSIVFYTEIPALKLNGVNREYNSPDFEILNGDFVCVGRDFNYLFAANSNSGGELKYKMEIPYRGISTYDSSLVLDSPGPYRNVEYAAGFTEAKPFGPGGRTPTIDKNTGLIYLNSRTVGLFVFSVVVEDYVDGVLLGRVKHDFQLPVIECDITKPPKPAVSHEGLVLSELDFCPGDEITLDVETENEADFFYQWQRDGINIDSARGLSLISSEEGEYRVIKSFKDRCADDIASDELLLKAAIPQPEIITNNPVICNDEDIVLEVKEESDFEFEWFSEGVPVGKGNSITINQDGWYSVLADKIGSACVSAEDSVFVESKISQMLPEPQLNYLACSGDSVLLETLEGTLLNYSWKRGNDIIGDKDKVWIRTSGTYNVFVTDENNCKQKSSDYLVDITDFPTIVFDSIGVACLSSGRPFVNLSASPAGGIFEGLGVQGNKFYPDIASAGIHEISYTFSAGPNCKATEKQKVEVLPSVDLSIDPPKAKIKIGDTLTLSAISSNGDLSYHWHPDLYLDGHNEPTVKASPTENITYKLTAVTKEGCDIEVEVEIEVVDPTNSDEFLFIPTAFSPNNDGINDDYVINFPFDTDLEILIYDRWGNLVFQTKDIDVSWNGTYLNRGKKPMPFGNYTGKLKYRNKEDELVGKQFSVFLMR